MDGLSFHICFQIVQRNLHEALAGCRAGPGNVRGDIAIAGGEQRIVGAGRFLRKNIDAGGVDASAVQCVGQVLLVDEWPASCVDEDGGGFHQAEAAGIDHFAGLLGEGAVQADDVAFGKQFVQLDLLDFGRQLEV